MELKIKPLFSILLSFILCSIIYQTKSVSCTDIITDLINYLNTPEPGYTRYLSFQMSGMKAPAKYVGFTSSGTISVQYYFQGGSAGILGRFQSYLYVKDAKTVFSDRTWCPQQPPGNYFCFGYQYFDYRAADTVQISFYKNSTMKQVLTTWGGATFSNSLQCKDGFLYGTLLDNSGNAFFTISFAKGKYGIIK